MPNTLDLEDDDCHDVVENLERVFDVRFSDEELSDCRTVGEQFDLIVRKLPFNPMAKKCAAAMVFYRIRNAMRVMGYTERLKPASDIRFLKRGARKQFKRIEAIAGLNLPRVESTSFGCAMAVITLVFVPAGLFLFFHSGTSIVIGLVIGVLAGVVILALDPGQLPEHCSTMAGLTRATTKLSLGRLANAGARYSEADIWERLTEMLSEYDLQKAEITRETFFLDKHLKEVSR